MPLIVRNTKTGGGTSINSGQIANASDVEVDVASMVGVINGNLDGTNLAAGADLALTQIADISATDSAHSATTTPGDSATHVKPTTLEGEIQQLRYAIEQHKIGAFGSTHAGRVDASGATVASWIDYPARNMTWIPGFNGSSSGLPAGWTNVNTATLVQEAANLSSAAAGKGRAIRITAAGGANEGMSYTLSGLKGGTRYLIVAIMKATAGDTAKLTTTGASAASGYRDLTGVGGAATSATEWTPVFGVVQTDATPTNLVVNVLAAADTDIVWVAHVGYAECDQVPLAADVSVSENPGGATAGTQLIDGGTDSGMTAGYRIVETGTTDVDATVYIPGDAYVLEVTAGFLGADSAAVTAANLVTWGIFGSVNGGAFASYTLNALSRETTAAGTTHYYSGYMQLVIKNPTPGASYRFVLAATRSVSNVQMQPSGIGHSYLNIKVSR